MTEDLINFLRARLDEDEAAVRALAEPHQWHTSPGDDPDWEDASTVYMWPPEFHTPYEQDKHWRGLTTSGLELATHIARHDPARVLREVQAKRQILALHVLAEQDDGDGFITLRCMVCDPEGSEPFYPCPTLRLLAAVYADHPDYRQEWRP